MPVAYGVLRFMRLGGFTWRDTIGWPAVSQLSSDSSRALESTGSGPSSVPIAGSGSAPGSPNAALRWSISMSMCVQRTWRNTPFTWLIPAQRRDWTS